MPSWSKLFILFSFLFSLVAFAREWEFHELSLKASVVKIRDGETKIKELVEEKSKTKDPEKRKEVLDKLINQYKELKKLYEDFENEKRHVRFEHPEQGMKIERRYRHYKLKTLEEFESEGGLEGKLNQLKLKVLKKYPDPVAASSDTEKVEATSAEEQKEKIMEKPKEAPKPPPRTERIKLSQ